MANHKHKPGEIANPGVLGDDDPDFDPIYQTVQDTHDNAMNWLAGSSIVLGSVALIAAEQQGKPEPLDSEVFGKIFNLDIVTDTKFFQDESGGIFNADQISSLQDLQSELKGNYIVSDPLTAENLSINNAKNISDMVGGFGAQESFKAGFINTVGNQSQLAGKDVPIAWMCDAGACPICQGYHAGGPYTADTFPCAPHYRCVCWPDIDDSAYADT